LSSDDCGKSKKKQNTKSQSHNIDTYEINIKMNVTMRAPDPGAYGPDPHPVYPQWISQICIVKSYTEDQAGQDIKPEDVVRPTNHCYCIGGKDIDENGQS